MFFKFCQPFIRHNINKNKKIPFPCNRLQLNKNYAKPDLDGENDDDTDNYTIPTYDPDILKGVTDYEWFLYQSCLEDDVQFVKDLRKEEQK